MHILTKSLIGIAAAGATATGGYFGLQALTEESVDSWAVNNKNWFKKWEAFKSKTEQQGNTDLRDKWFQLSNSFRSKTALSAYGLAREFQKWCGTSGANAEEYSEIKSGICSN